MELCKLCGKESGALEHEIEQSVIRMIKNANPDWVEKDGGCAKCIEYYEGLDDTVQFRS